MKTEELVRKAAQWGINKGITGPKGTGTIEKQFRKFIEELAELFEALKKNDIKEVRDALGDLQVVTIQAYGLIYRGTFSGGWGTSDILRDENIESALLNACCRLNTQPRLAFHVVRAVAIELGHDPDECLEEAYNVISKRTGKMVDGVFVKDDPTDPDADLEEPLGQACQLNEEGCESCQ